MTPTSADRPEHAKSVPPTSRYRSLMRMPCGAHHSIQFEDGARSICLTAQVRTVGPDLVGTLTEIDATVRSAMCRNIKTLFNFEPPATQDEIRAASLQFVRKLSGFNKPSKANREAFDAAVDAVACIADELMGSLTTTSVPRNRETEAEKARERVAKRFGPRPAATG